MENKVINTKLVPRIFGLIYGASGTGKTHMIGSLGLHGKVLVIDVDQGYETLIFGKGITDAMRENITVVSFDKFKDLDSAFKLCKSNDAKKWSAAIDVEVTEPFDWIVWDTWSELQWHMLQELRSKDTEMSGSGLDFRKNIQIQHWGMMTDLNKLSIQQFRTLSVNQVFTMQEKMEKDEISGQVYGGPAIHGKMVQEMPTFFNVVVRTYTDIQGKWCATTKSKNRWPAKTRLGEGKDYVNPTAAEVFNL